MKFKKQSNVAFFSKYTREDGKFTIESVDRRINGTFKNVFEVTDETGKVIDTLPRLKDVESEIRKRMTGTKKARRGMTPDGLRFCPNRTC